MKALKDLQDMMEADPNLLDNFLADIDNQIWLKKTHLREAKAAMKTMPQMKNELQKIVDDYQADIDYLLAEKEAQQ